MLVTNPPARATLAEVMNHPWMTRGFPGPPDPHLDHREPLRSDELDRNVIREMEGSQFGTEEEIEKKLLEVLGSDQYHHAVQHWERKRDTNTGQNGVVNDKDRKTPSNTSLVYESARTDLTASPSKKSRGFPGFDFYRRKLFSSPPVTPTSHSPPESKTHGPADPMYGFHPLISVYFLTREKLERERVYGPGHFASSQLSLTTNAAINNSTGVRTDDGTTQPTGSATQSANPPIKTTTTEPTAKTDYSMSLLRPPTPESSHHSSTSCEPTAPTRSPNTQTSHPQLRFRDSTGLPIKRANSMSDLGSQPPASPNKIPIRPPQLSTYKGGYSLSQQRSVEPAWAGMLGPPNPVQEEEQVTDTGDQQSQSQSRRLPGAHRHAHAVLDPHGRAGRHERSSAGGSPSSGKTHDRHRQPPTSFSTVSRPFGGEKSFGKIKGVAEDTANNGATEYGHAVLSFHRP
jgi:hypothetical protein